MVAKVKPKSKKADQKELSLKERRFGVILEDIQKKFRQVLEGHGGLDNKIDEFRHEMRSKIGFLEFGSRLLSDKQKDIEVKIDKSFKDLKAYLSNLDDYLKEAIADLKTKLDRKTELKRMEALEVEVAGIKEQLAKIK